MNHSRTLTVGWAFILVAAATCFSMPGWLEDAVDESAGISVPVEATAITLRKVADVEISSGGRARTRLKYAIKILTSDGMEFATLSQPVYPFLKSKHLKGWVVRPDGSSRELDKANILTVGGQGSAGYYDDSHILIARASHVEPGDIVAFEMELEEKGWTSFLQSFTFQIQQPVRLARFSVEVPRGWDVSYGTWRAGSIGFQHQDERYVWTATDLEYQPEEPLAPSWYYLSRRIGFACFDPEEEGTTFFADWPSVAQWCSDVYTEPSSVTPDVRQQALDIVSGEATFEDKVAAISDFIQKEIRYVAVEIGKHRWQPRPAATTLFNRYGDCKDKTVLTVSMLDAVGIEAVPVLCNPVYPVDLRVPTPFQFNHCIVAISLPGEEVSSEFENAVVGDWLIFDPTDQTTGIGQVPSSLQGDRVLLGAVADSVMVGIPYPDPKDFIRIYDGEMELGRDGSFTGRVTITDFGGLAALSGYQRRITSEKDQIDHWVGTISKTVPSVEIGDYQAGEGGDSAWVSFTVRGNHYIQDTGGLSLLRPDIFHPPSPPVLTSHERRFPVWFGPPREVVSRVDWTLPQGWTAEVDTGLIDHQCGSARVSSRMSLSVQGLSIITTYGQDGHLIMPEDYESARRFNHDLSQVRGQIAMIHKQESGD
jgi:transglutaminase-like putative cysteine protease